MLRLKGVNKLAYYVPRLEVEKVAFGSERWSGACAPHSQFTTQHLVHCHLSLLKGSYCDHFKINSSAD